MLEFLDTVLSSFLTVFISELGDKTFISTAMLAMKYSKSAVLCGNFSSMTIMMLLASYIGYTVMVLISPETVKILSILVFFYFAVVSWTEASSEDDEKIQEKKIHNSWKSVFLQTMALVFFAEWGDKSQIGIIALSAQYPVLWVLTGAELAILACGSIAVLSGHLCEGYLSHSYMSYISSFIFLSFSLFSLKDYLI
jgi:putative Ca2+/H+ antiporter (TMEM165/GDT1 family)